MLSVFEFVFREIAYKMQNVSARWNFTDLSWLRKSLWKYLNKLYKAGTTSQIEMYVKSLMHFPGDFFLNRIFPL